MQISKKALFMGFLASLLMLGLSGFQSEDTYLAKVRKTKKGYAYSDINYKMIRMELKNGYRVLKVDFHHMEGKFYLVRQIEGPKGETGTFYSQIKYVNGDLKRPDKWDREFTGYFACWQVAKCLCTRPQRYNDCKCAYDRQEACTVEPGVDMWPATRIYNEG